jgi:D-beta-D-heptose 7-phosphate kinase/D-beta-D-heptose 1-phosphate adenosyltransferase
LSDYGKGVLTHQLCRTLIETARSFKIPIVTDPKSNDLSRYHGTTLIKPNLKEGRELLRSWDATLSLHHFDEEVDAICETIARQSAAQGVVLSLSEHGVALKVASQTATRRYASRALQVADVSGAGDTMVAFLAMATASGASMSAATEIANVGAALVCAKLGTATLASSEVLQALTSDPSLRAAHSPKILREESLPVLAQTLRRNGRKVVFTNGCFDLLHMGHVDLLERARALGDVLIVGLNTDASIRRLKGAERPVQTFESRSRVLAGLAAVDFVVGFEQDTPIELIRQISPQVLVKGGDYTIESVVGAEIVMAAGGKVEILSLVPGHSTTGLVEKARVPV